MAEQALTNIPLPLEMCFQWEVQRADKPYLIQPVGGGEVKKYTWKEAMAEARSMAAFLKNQGYPAGSRIAIVSKNCAHWIMCDIAIMLAGYVSVPLYPTLTTESVKKVMVHSEAVAAFVGKLDAWDDMLAGIPESVKCISFPSSPKNDFQTWDDIVQNTMPLTGQPSFGPDDLATIIYTSGTTGEPKGVMHSFSNLMICAIATSELSGATANDKMLSYLPLSHVAERSGTEMSSILSGFEVYFTESLETFAADLQRARPTIFFSVPRLWVKFQQAVNSKLPEAKLRRLLRLPIVGNIIRQKVLRQLGLDSVRVAGTGAAPLPEAILNWYRLLGLDLLEVYGMTEICGSSHSCRPNEMRVGYVGPPLRGVECKLSEAGEILVRSQGNTLGYYKDPEKTAELFTDDGFIKTGDRGVVDEKGRYRIVGRTKEIFKTSKGKYVAPAPIENALSVHPDIEACCVMGANAAQPCALLMLSLEAQEKLNQSDDKSPFIGEMTEHLAAINKGLDAHEKLAFLVVAADQWEIENGFLTPTMKIKRAVIEAHYNESLDAWYSAKTAVILQ